MKKILLLFACISILLSCDNGEIQPKDDNTFTLEGTWYISGRSGIYKFENDTVSFNYDENVLGYEEHTFSLIDGKKNEYAISTKMKYLQQNANESDEEYCDRIENGKYSIEELVEIKVEKFSWIILGHNIYLPGKYISDIMPKDKYLVSKIVKSSKDQFVIVSICPTIWDYTIEENFEYYITFSRIK